jgi:hypothetical protein
MATILTPLETSLYHCHLDSYPYNGKTTEQMRTSTERYAKEQENRCDVPPSENIREENPSRWDHGSTSGSATLDHCAKGEEFPNIILIASIDMLDSRDYGLTFCNETGENQRRPPA